MIKYKTWLDSIKKVEVERETEQSVFFKAPSSTNGLRSERKKSYGMGYFDTWLEAKTYIESIEQHKINVLEAKISYHITILNKIRNLKEEE